MPTVAQLLIEIRAGSSKLVTDLGRSMSAVRKFERQVGQVGKTLTTNISLPLGALATGALRSSIQLESAFAGVRKTFNDTGKSAQQVEKELSAIQKGIRDMSKEIPASAPQIAKVVELTQQMGVKGTKNVLTFARAMIDLGESTDIIATDATLKLAKFMSVMNTSAQDSTRLGSSIVDLGNKFSTTESEIVEMATRLAVTTNRLKITEAETLGMAAALTSLGIRAEAGGTAFSRFLIEMAASVDAGGDSLQQFAAVAGVTTTQFAAMFKDNAADATAQFLDGLIRMEKQGISTFQILDSMGLSEVRLRQAILATSGAQGRFNETLKVSRDAWTNNVALQKEAAQRYATTESKLRIFKNVIEDAGRIIGDILIPHAINLAKQAAGLAQAFERLSPETQKFLVEALAISAALGPIIYGFSGLIRVFTTLGLATQAAKTGWAALASLFKSTAQAWSVIANVARLVGAGFEYFVSVLRIAAAPFATVGSLILALGAGLGLFLAVVDAAGTDTKLFLSGFVELWHNAVAKVSEYWGQFTSWLSEQWSQFQAGFLQGLEMQLGWIDQWLQAIGVDAPKIFRDAVGRIKILWDQFVQTFWHGISSLMEGWDSFLSDFRAGIWGLGRLLNVKAWQQWAVEGERAARKLGKVVPQELKDVETKLDSVGKIAVSSTAKMNKSFKETGDTTGELSDDVRKLFGGTKDGAKEAEKALDKLQQKWKEVAGEIEAKRIRKAIEQAVKDGNEADLEPLFQKLRALTEEGIRQGLADAAEKGGAEAQALADKIAQAKADAEIKAEREQVHQQILESRKSAYEEGVSFWSGLMEDAITDTRFDWEAQMKKAAVRIAAHFLTVLTQTNGALSQLFGGLNSVSSFFGFEIPGVGGGGTLTNLLGGAAGSAGVASLAGGAGSGAAVVGSATTASGAPGLLLADGSIIAAPAGGGAAGGGLLAAAAPAALAGIAALYGTSIYRSGSGLFDSSGSNDLTSGINLALLSNPFTAPLGILSDFLGLSFGSQGDPAALERKQVEQFIEDRLSELQQANTPFQLFNSDGVLENFGGDFIFGDRGRFEDAGWAEEFWANFGEAGGDVFNALGAAFAQFMGLSEDNASQLALIFAENLGTGDLEQNLDNINLFLQAMGISSDDLQSSILELANAGEISWHQFEVFRQSLEKLPEEGVAAAGAYSRAMEIVLESGGRGVRALQALQILAIEAGEAGVTSLDELKEALIKAGFQAEVVDALFQAFANRGIESLDDLRNANESSLGGIIADLDTFFQESGRGWDAYAADVLESVRSVDKLGRQLDGLPQTKQINIKIHETTYRSTINDTPEPSKFGNVFGTRQFANGGIISGRTNFRFGAGFPGVAGEMGPEAILPLKRIGANLGVYADLGSMKQSQNVYNIDARWSAPGVEQLILHALEERAVSRSISAVRQEMMRAGR